MWPTIFILIAAILIGFVVIVALRPPTFRIARQITISAPPSTVFGLVNDFHKWDAWSPWAKLDPNMRQSFEGPASGVGAMYSWNGNKKVGQGKMTILESRPGEWVCIKLEFLKPFAATNTAEFTFKPVGNQTAVLWAMTGQNNFMGKLFGLICNMDKMIGKDFEKGLSQMKAAAEGLQS